ncbi:response regulator transcription factor [bacterium]|nr:response regulator transcription factor [bacterium]
MIKVSIVEDNVNIRKGLAVLVDGTEGYECVETFSDCETMLRKIMSLKPHIILMDIGLKGMNGIDGVKAVKKILPDVNVIMLSVFEDDDLIFNALCAGACGYLTKRTPPARILEAIKEAHEGGSPMNAHIARKVVNLFKNKEVHKENPAESVQLSLKERRILNLLADGSSYDEIAEALFISISTVRYHIGNIYKKLYVVNQTEAVAKALRKGII